MLRKNAKVSCFLDGFRSAPGVQFLQQSGDMGFDGVWRDVELAGDLLVGEPFGQQFQDFKLAVSHAERRPGLWISLILRRGG